MPPKLSASVSLPVSPCPEVAQAPFPGTRDQVNITRGFLWQNWSQCLNTRTRSLGQERAGLEGRTRIVLEAGQPFPGLSPRQPTSLPKEAVHLFTQASRAVRFEAGTEGRLATLFLLTRNIPDFLLSRGR